MSPKWKYKIIAVFLLTVFSLNTIAGFACSIGVDMGYNTRHHEHKKHTHGKGHKHQTAHPAHKYIPGLKLTGTKDDCCSGAVNQFQQLTKALVHNHLLLQPPVTIINNHTLFTRSNDEEPGLTVNSRFQFVRRSCFLNDTDIQTAIRRFQI